MPLYILTLRHIRYYCILKRSILSLRTTLKFFSLVPFFFSSFYLIFIGVWILTHEVVSNSLSYTANSCGFSLCVTIHKHTCIFLPLTQLCILQLTIVFFFSKLISTMPFRKGSLVNSLYIQSSQDYSRGVYVPYLTTNWSMVFDECQSTKKLDLKSKANTHKSVSHTT